MLQQALLFTLIPLAAAVASGVVALYWTPGPTARSYIQHFAAGIVLAAVIGELLSDVVSRQQQVLAALVGFVLGLLLMLGIKLASHAGGGHGNAMSLTVTAGVDTLVDGFVIGLGFVVGGGTGALLAVALAIELFFLGLSASAAVVQSGKPGWWTLAVGLGLGLLVMIGSAAGVILLGGASGFVVTVVLAFGAIALLYLVTEELLVNVRNVPETPWHTLVLFTGFILVFVIEMLVH